jgi:hypothetical protein
MRLMMFLAALMSLVVQFGCDSETTDANKCTDEKGCAVGFVCVEGTCTRIECQKDSDAQQTSALRMASSPMNPEAVLFARHLSGGQRLRRGSQVQCVQAVRGWHGSGAMT